MPGLKEWEAALELLGVECKSRSRSCEVNSGHRGMSPARNYVSQ